MVRLVLIAALAALNAYLLFFKLPERFHEGSKQPASVVAPTTHPFSKSDQAVTAFPFENSLGEMGGVAGIRNVSSTGFELIPWLTSFRFNLAKAHGVAGQRALRNWCDRIQGTIERSDTFTTALTRHGITGSRLFYLVRALQAVFDFRSMRAGERFELWLSPVGDIQRFVYQRTPVVTYLIERTAGKLAGRRVEETTHQKLAPLSLRIQDSLYASLARAGESPALVMMLVDIFAWDIDFYIDTHAGDIIRLLVEKHEVGGEFVHYGHILAADYRGQIGVHRAFRYETTKGTIGYYDEKGNSLRKAFLKSPLKFTVVSSGYGTRVHPILGFSKMHQGIDLAAPLGTPIWAPADGRVIFSGRKGSSGKLVVLRHVNNYETIFAHLQYIAPGIRKGVRVKQRQVIGKVGSTGLSTGPHLHYGMKNRGRHVNPFKQRFPPANPISKDEWSRFQTSIAPLVKRLESIALPPTTQTASVRREEKKTG